LLKCFPAWVRLFFRPAIGAAGKRRKNGRRAQDNAAANCLGEVIERLSMTEIEIDCETAMKEILFQYKQRAAKCPSACL
jgi:hypothetical protein